MSYLCSTKQNNNNSALPNHGQSVNMLHNFKRSDFVITYGVKVEYLGDQWFERPKNLTKYDMATILEKIKGVDSLWTIIYDAFTKRDLVVELTEALNDL